MHRRHRSDLNQAKIVRELRQAGCAVYVIGQPVDLLIWSRGGLHLVDVKNPARWVKTPAQEKFERFWPGPVHFCETAEEILRIVGVTKE